MAASGKRLLIVNGLIHQPEDCRIQDRRGPSGEELHRSGSQEQHKPASGEKEEATRRFRLSRIDICTHSLCTQVTQTDLYLSY